MATIYRSTRLDVDADSAWDFIERYTRAEVHVFSNCVSERLEGEYRVVVTDDGSEIWERNVTVDPEHRRSVYTIPDFPGAEHHQAEMRIVPDGDGAVLHWTTDLVPDAVAQAMEPIYDRMFSDLVSAITHGAGSRAMTDRKEGKG